MRVSDRVILGIDPGTVVMGYGLLVIRDGVMTAGELGVLRLDKDKEHPDRLKRIFDFTEGLIRQHCPDEMAIEAPFFGKNVQSMLKLGRAQGVAIAAALHLKIPVCEYAPRRIKQSITGNGNASKEQVAGMLQTLVRTSMAEIPLDATDALAAAVCHHFSNSKGISAAKGYSGWDAFLKQNPGRVKG